MKKQLRADKQHTGKTTGFSGTVGPFVLDDELLYSQLGNQRLVTAIAGLISAVENTYQAFGVRLSVVYGHDDRHNGIRSFVQVHAVLPETGLLDRLEPESRFPLQDLLYPTMSEINLREDSGLVALCQHFHSQPLLTRMLAVKSERDRHIADEVSPSGARKLATSAR